MSSFLRNDNFRFALLIICVLLSRLPFISDGYGLDGDSWSVALVARTLFDTGVYEVSRLPGYPVHEYLSAVGIEFGAFGVNLITAVFSTIGVAFFFLSLRVLRFRRPYLASITFASIPVFFIHSTTAIDYNFALSFILASFYFLLKEKWVFSGILLGFAVGCRITSGAMLIPFAIIALGPYGLKENLIRIFKIGISTIITAIVLFYPVYSKYGLDFFTFYNVPYPSIPKVLYKFSIEVWGVLGCAGLIISTLIIFFTNRHVKRQYLFPRSVNEKYIISWLVAIDIYIIAFLKLPMESGYLLPIVPFVIFIFGKYLFDEAFVFLSVMLILSPLIMTISPEDRLDASTPSKVSFDFEAGGEGLMFDVLKGPVISYQSRRANGLKFVQDVLNGIDTVSNKSVLVSGRWYNQFLVQQGDTVRNNVIFKSYLDEPEAVYYFAKGYEIYFMPKQEFYNKIMRGIDLEIYGAVPYIKSEEY